LERFSKPQKEKLDRNIQINFRIPKNFEDEILCSWMKLHFPSALSYICLFCIILENSWYSNQTSNAVLLLIFRLNEADFSKKNTDERTRKLETVWIISFDDLFLNQNWIAL
jgi:hypothetical protein